MIRRLTYQLAFTLLIATSSYAGTIYDNGSPNGQNGADLSNFTLSDDFSMTSQTTISSFRFWIIAAKASDFTGTISYEIFGSANSAPTGTPMVSATATALTATATGAKLGVAGFAEYQIDVTLAAPLQVNAGSYWLALHQGSFTTTTPTHPYWETTNAQASTISAGFEYRYTPGTTSAGFVSGSSGPSLRDLAFVINPGGTVGGDPGGLPADPLGAPEPASIGLLGAGLAGLVWRRCKSAH